MDSVTPVSEPTHALEGPAIDVTFNHGWRTSHQFHGAQVTWNITEGDGVGQSVTHDYRAMEVRPDIFFVDFVKGSAAPLSPMSTAREKA